MYKVRDKLFFHYNAYGFIIYYDFIPVATGGYMLGPRPRTAISHDYYGKLARLTFNLILSGFAPEQIYRHINSINKSMGWAEIERGR